MAERHVVACALCVGGAAEPYLGAALAAVRDAVDVLTVNDNAPGTNPNAATLAASAFAERGALSVERHPFVDFADMRNRAFAQLGRLGVRPDWVLFLDADEVHGEQVRYVARELLPRLGPNVGSVDAYTFHFFGTFSWITDVARRFCFYRYDPAIAWVNAVHEKAIGLRGRALVLPYVYHHYGNVATPRALAEKHGRYHALGNPVPAPPAPGDATLEVYLAGAAAVRPFRGKHPAAAVGTIAALERERGAAFAELDAGFRARRTVVDRAASELRRANETLRVRLRALEHPGLFRAPTAAR